MHLGLSSVALLAGSTKSHFVFSPPATEGGKITSTSTFSVTRWSTTSKHNSSKASYWGWTPFTQKVFPYLGVKSPIAVELAETRWPWRLYHMIHMIPTQWAPPVCSVSLLIYSHLWQTHHCCLLKFQRNIDKAEFHCMFIWSLFKFTLRNVLYKHESCSLTRHNIGLRLGVPIITSMLMRESWAVDVSHISAFSFQTTTRGQGIKYQEYNNNAVPLSKAPKPSPLLYRADQRPKDKAVVVARLPDLIIIVWGRALLQKVNLPWINKAL